jgi:uncharacterized protein YfaT (DUF1175 family)
MLAFVAATLIASPPPAMLRTVVAQTAIRQAKKIDPAWHAKQRDCAGLVRFAYREAYRRFEPKRLERGLWKNAMGEAIAFADAETLLANSFRRIGRTSDAMRSAESGDLVAFRQRDGTYHLMLVVRTDGPATGDALVVYHPGDGGSELRVGTLRDLAEEAPHEWRPRPENGAFLGFYRFEEWAR